MISDRDKSEDDRATTPESLRSSSPPSSPPPQWQPSAPTTATSPRRFISSILGGDVPYGSRGHVLTRAERKEYSSPLVVPSNDQQLPGKSERIELPRPPTPPATPRLEPPTRVSVIQRVPQSIKPRKEHTKLEVPASQEPEQDQPIDYAVPKRKEDVDEERGREGAAKASRTFGNSIARPLLAMRLSAPGTLQAAAGHGRSTNSSNTGSSSGGSSNSSSSGGSSSGGSGGLSFSGSGGGGGGGVSGGGGAMGGAGGGMNPGGNGGRGNYGPSSPPTGSLPPFYESLKGGNNLANFANQYGSQGNNFLTPTSVGMECDTGQQDINSGHSQYGAQEGGKQYQLLQNMASYGLVLKEEEEDLASVYKLQPDLLSGQYGAYDVTDSGMMVDMVTGTMVDPLQFTATLTFSSPSDHNALLESLSDAADLFLPRLPADDGHDLLEDSLHSPASAGSGINQDGQMTTPVEPSVDPFPEHGIPLSRAFDGSNRHYNASHYSNKLSGITYSNEPNYQPLAKERSELALHINPNQHQEPQLQQLQIQVQMQQQHQGQQPPRSPLQQHHQDLLSPGLNFPGSGELASNV